MLTSCASMINWLSNLNSAVQSSSVYICLCKKLSFPVMTLSEKLDGFSPNTTDTYFLLYLESNFLKTEKECHAREINAFLFLELVLLFSFSLCCWLLQFFCQSMIMIKEMRSLRKMVWFFKRLIPYVKWYIIIKQQHTFPNYQLVHLKMKTSRQLRKSNRKAVKNLIIL